MNEEHQDMSEVEGDVKDVKDDKDGEGWKDVELLEIVADVLEMEKEIDVEASNIVEFSSNNISDQPLFLQPILEPEAGVHDATADDVIMDDARVDQDDEKGISLFFRFQMCEERAVQCALLL